MGRRREVDDWFDAYENPMKPVVERIREVVLASDARVDECIKWKAPTFTYRGNIASFYPIERGLEPILHPEAKLGMRLQA